MLLLCIFSAFFSRLCVFFENLLSCPTLLELGYQLSRLWPKDTCEMDPSAVDCNIVYASACLLTNDLGHVVTMIVVHEAYVV